MKRIKSYADLLRLRDETRKKIASYSEPDSHTSRVIIKVGMGTSGLASGAREVKDFIQDAIIKRNIEAEVFAAGDMGYSYAEPTILVKKPGDAPLTFGNVSIDKADEIIEKYIKEGEQPEGIIPPDYLTIDEI